jgi:hypothetical protein
MEPVLTKYNMAAEFVRKKPVSDKSDEYKDAAALIGFRDHLMHFKPRWDKARTNFELENALQGKFSPSQFTTSDDPFLDRQSMSSGCA